MLNDSVSLWNDGPQFGCTILEAGWEEFCLAYESVETQNCRHMPHGELVMEQAEQDALQRI